MVDNKNLSSNRLVATDLAYLQLLFAEYHPSP